MITPVQTSGGHSSVAAPSSIAPTWSATQAGSTLVLALGLALSGAPAVTPPAGWVQFGSTVQGTAVAVYLFALVNAPAGSTTFGFLLTNANGAAWQLWELGGAAPGPTSQDNALVKSQSAASGTTCNGAAYSPRAYGGTFDMFVCAYLSGGGAYTDATVTGGIGAQSTSATQTSTTGATNVSLLATTIQQGPSGSVAYLPGGTIAVSAAHAQLQAALLASDSASICHTSYGGATLGASPVSIGGL